MNVSNTVQACVSKIVKKQPFVKDIFASICNQGGKILLVGGAVRDLFLEKTIKDLDFEVYGLSLEQLQHTLQQYGTVSFIGKSFGVLRLHGLDIDWSLPRTDSSGRHPIVAYDSYMSYQQAFIRRDLTINAMGIDMQTMELVDLYQGLHDLENKILRSPDLHFFIQDPLRLLRVMQFVGRFEMSVDQQLSDVCSGMDISLVSKERIEQEFSKLFLQSDKPSLGLRWLIKIGKFDHFLPGVIVSDDLFFKIDAAAQLNHRCEQHKLALIWAVITSFCKGNLAIEGIEFFRITHQQQQNSIHFMKKNTQKQSLIHQVADIVWYSKLIDASLTDAQLKWIAVWIAPETSIRLLLEFVALYKGKKIADKLLHQAESLGVADRALEPLLSGKDFLDVAQGAQLGELVKEAYKMQIDQGLVDRSVLKNRVIIWYL